MLVAGLDIGSNTVRLLIGELSRDPDRPERTLIERVHESSKITRLGEGVLSSRCLGDKARSRTIDALKMFRKTVDRYSVYETVCVGTSAIRDSINSEEFRLQLFNETGFELEIISGEEEARRTLLGVECKLAYIPSRYLIIDIGGGSTELILRTEDRAVQLISLPLGVIKLTEQWLRSDPPLSMELKNLEDQIDEVIKKECTEWGSMAGSIVIGTAGTATTMAAMELGFKRYDPDKVQGLRMTLAQVQVRYNALIILSLSKRREIVGLEPGREDVILAGLAILLSVLNMTESKEWIVSDAGLREGLLIKCYVENKGKWKT